MELHRCDDLHAFERRARAFLVAREAEHNLMLGTLSTLASGRHVYVPPHYFGVVEREGAVVAAAMRTPPFDLVLSLIDDPAALPLILEDVRAVYGPDLTGVLGPRGPADELARRWTERTGVPHRLLMAERIHRLTAVRPPAGVRGAVRPATADDLPLLVEWMSSFHAEASEPAPRGLVERQVAGILAGERWRGLRLWVDEGRVVSMTGFMGPTPRGIRIGAVYTPPERRGRGYASACVAATSQEMLDAGRAVCFLFTDLANPTSNRIYARIGYEPVVDVDHFRFGAGYRRE